MDKKSKYYMKTEFKSALYGNDYSTTCEKELRISGNNKKYVDSTAAYIKSGVMP